MIHCQKLIRNNLLLDAFSGFSYYSVWIMLILSTLTPIAIYLTCSGLDWVRLIILKKIKLKQRLLRIEELVTDKVCEKS